MEHKVVIDIVWMIGCRILATVLLGFGMLIAISKHRDEALPHIVFALFLGLVSAFFSIGAAADIRMLLPQANR